VLLHLSYSNAIAQNIDLTTGVIVPILSTGIVLDASNTAMVGTNTAPTNTAISSTTNLLTKSGWTGIGYGNSSTVGQCCSGGPTAVMNTDTNTIRFSYGWSTASQTIAINDALFQATGIRINGYTASALVNNGGQNTGPLSGSVSVKNNFGSVIDTQTFDLSNLNNDGNFEKVSLTRYFANPYQVSELGSITASWTGKDDRFWAGFYGPRVRDSSLTLQYYVDPCIRNPASSPTCSGYNSLLTSINIVPYPNSSAIEGSPLNNTFPIATALSNSGSGLALHGFKYGFTYELGPSTPTNECVSWTNAFTCGAYLRNYSTANIKVDIRNSSNQSLFSSSYGFKGPSEGPQSMAYQYLFPQSTNTNLMGNFGFNASVVGQGSVYNMYSKLIVTPDPCTSNPYSSSKCSGFTEAIAKLSGTNTTDYVTTGYTEPATVTASTMAPTTLGSSTSGVVVDPNAIASVQQGQPLQLQPQQGPQNQQQQQSQGQQLPPGTAIVSASPTANNPQPKVGEVASGKQSSPNDNSSGGPNVMQIVSMIQNQQARITATEKTVVQQAEQQAQQAMQQTNDQALNFANNIITQSAANSMTVTNSDTTKTTKSQNQEGTFSLPNMSPTPGSTSVVKAMTAPQTYETTITTTPGSTSVVKAMTAPQTYETSLVITTANTNTLKPTEQKTTFETTTVSTGAISLLDGIKQIQQDFTTATAQEYKFALLQPNVTQQFTNTETYNTESSKLVLKSENNATTSQQIASIEPSDNNKLGLKPGMLNLTEQKSTTQLSATTEEKPTTVNKNVQQNELASGVTLATLATQPAGYDAYSLFTLKDASFYAPKEIYKNQRTVDNARALRVLSSDRLHQEMIDQQYKVKN
jgi:hypothetical protein